MRSIDLRRWLPFFVESGTPADRAFLIGQLQGVLDALEPPRTTKVASDLLHLSEQIALLSNALELLRSQPPLPSATAANSALSFAEPNPSLQTPLPAEAISLPQTPPSQHLAISASLDASLSPAQARLQLHSALRWLKITLPISLPLAFLLALIIAQTIASKEKSVPVRSLLKQEENKNLRSTAPHRSLIK